MVSKLIEEINRKLQEAEKETNNIYNKLELDRDFNKWFEELAREKKLEIYKIYQLEEMEFDL